MSKESSSHRPHRSSLTRRGVNVLLAGLAAVVPIVGTVWLLVLIYQVLLKVGKAIIYGIVGFLDVLRGVQYENEQVVGDLEAWKGALPPENAYFWSFVPLALLFLVGAAVTKTPGRKVLNLMDRALMKVPFMGFVYSTLKQGVDAFRNLGGARKFKGVAYVAYPSDGCRLLGFVTGNYHDPQTGKDVTSVFIPTSPNPMTGFVIIVDDERIFDSDLTVEQASKLILSAGLVGPAETAGSPPQATGSPPQDEQAAGEGGA